MEKREFYTLPEVADMFRVSTACVRRWVKLGNLEAIQFGRKILIPIAAITKMRNASFSPVEKKGN